MTLTLRVWNGGALGWRSLAAVNSYLDAYEMLHDYAVSKGDKVQGIDWDHFEQMGMLLEKYARVFSDVSVYLNDDFITIMQERSTTDMRGMFWMEFMKGRIHVVVHSYFAIDRNYYSMKEISSREIVGAISGIHMK